MMQAESFIPSQLSGRNRRLLVEWRRLEEQLSARKDIRLEVIGRNAAMLPVCYEIHYMIRSICGVGNIDSLGQKGCYNPPLFANHFRMRIDLPPSYPSVDGAPVFRFLTVDEAGRSIPHPWHPNIRYFGEMAGRVCLNAVDTFTELAWGVERIAQYLRYEIYHALSEPPYPEDMQVAAWVVRQGEPNEWVYFDQENNDDE